MALSKVQNMNINNVCSRINRINGQPLKTLINKEEIEQMCCVEKPKAVSIELINHMLGGPNMEYHLIENDESFEAFDYLRTRLMEELQEKKLEIMFFEDRKGVSSNIIVVIVKQPKEHGLREHIIMKVLIRMTIMVEPKIGYCRYFNLTGKYSFTVYSIINDNLH